VITIPLEYVNDAVIPGSVGLNSKINGKFANSTQSGQFGVGVGVGVGGGSVGVTVGVTVGVGVGVGVDPLRYNNESLHSGILEALYILIPQF